MTKILFLFRLKNETKIRNMPKGRYCVKMAKLKDLKKKIRIKNLVTYVCNFLQININENDELTLQFHNIDCILAEDNGPIDSDIRNTLKKYARKVVMHAYQTDDYRLLDEFIYRNIITPEEFNSFDTKLLIWLRGDNYEILATEYIKKNLSFLMDNYHARYIISDMFKYWYLGSKVKCLFDLFIPYLRREDIQHWILVKMTTYAFIDEQDCAYIMDQAAIGLNNFYYGATPLMYAVYRCIDVKYVIYLLESGADPNIQGSQNNMHGYTALHYLSQRIRNAKLSEEKYTSILEQLLKYGADINKRSGQAYTNNISEQSAYEFLCDTVSKDYIEKIISKTNNNELMTKNVMCNDGDVSYRVVPHDGSSTCDVVIMDLFRYIQHKDVSYIYRNNKLTLDLPGHESSVVLDL